MLIPNDFVLRNSLFIHMHPLPIKLMLQFTIKVLQELFFQWRKNPNPHLQRKINIYSLWKLIILFQSKITQDKRISLFTANTHERFLFLCGLFQHQITHNTILTALRCLDYIKLFSHEATISLRNTVFVQCRILSAGTQVYL